MNPSRTEWLRSARWGLFTHYLPHMPSAPIPEDMTPERWNQKVNSFRVDVLADQLEEVKAPYYFITIQQGGGYTCSPNEAYDRLMGSEPGRRSERDLIADLAAALVPRGIRLCVYHTAGFKGDEKRCEAWLDVVREWSHRWSDAVSAWWIDGAGLDTDPDTLGKAVDAYRSGNPEALVSFNTLPVGWNRDQLLPATEREDYLAGECDYFLPTCGTRVFDGKEYYLGPDISGDQLHFLNFLGAWWGTGEPRFRDELVISWTRHINDHGGTVSWDLPVSDDGVISESYMRQLRALRDGLGVP